MFDEGTFSLCSFWYVECLSRAGRLEEARYYLEKMFMKPIDQIFSVAYSGAVPELTETKYIPQSNLSYPLSNPIKFMVMLLRRLKKAGDTRTPVAIARSVAERFKQGPFTLVQEKKKPAQKKLAFADME